MDLHNLRRSVAATRHVGNPRARVRELNRIDATLPTAQRQSTPGLPPPNYKNRGSDGDVPQRIHDKLDAVDSAEARRKLKLALTAAGVVL